MDGDGAMLEADGVEAGAEEALEPVLEPPQAVRLSMVAAAIPATAKVVRLMVCISNLLCCADFVAGSERLCRCGPYPTDGHRPLVGVSMGIRGLGGKGWVGFEILFRRVSSPCRLVPAAGGRAAARPGVPAAGRRRQARPP